MLHKLTYNRMALFRFISSAFVVCAYLLKMFLSERMPELLNDIILILALIPYAAIMVTNVTATSEKSPSRVLVDELSKQNEAKASQFSWTITLLFVFCGIAVTRFTEREITLGSDALFCIVLGIWAIKDGFYLFLERGGGKKDAGNDD